MPPVIYLMGPTAAGKTALAFEIVDRFNCEIISVDSALIYRDVNIGTAKPDAETLQKYPHHLVDILDPTESYSVASFCEAAREVISRIHSRENVPLLVGGTMLYFNALQKGLAVLPASDESIRKQLELEKQKHGLDWMHAMLSDVDPESAARIHKNDPQRILRALEVWHLSGRPLSHFYREQPDEQCDLDVLKLCVSCSDRSVLHNRIASRFDQMLDNDFVNEVSELQNKYNTLTADMPSMRCVGYRQVWNYLSGEYDKVTMREKGIVATRQLAKRQLTWLRGMDDVQWFESGESSDAIFSKIDAHLRK